jgi:aspartate carbamoyltransferase catalytic subunit
MGSTVPTQPGIVIPSDVRVQDTIKLDDVTIPVTETLSKTFTVYRSVTTNAIVIRNPDNGKKYVLGPKGIAMLAVRAGILEDR